MDSIEKPISIYAAGSLRNALPALVEAFKTVAGDDIVVRHGPAGLLRARIEAGDRPDVFLSANVAHPLRLVEIGLAPPPVVFARNILAAIVRKDAGIGTENLIDRLLAPDVTIATSTPLNDPSGDYAWELFRKVDAIRPGAFEILETKAQKLVGGTEHANPPGNYDVIAEALKAGTATLFLGYRTGLGPLAAKLAAVEVVTIPPEVNVIPQYGMAVLNDCSRAGMAFALFILSATGQKLLADFGFRPVALPDQS